MKTFAPVLGLTGLALLCSPVSQARAAERDTAVLEDAAEVLDSLATIPLVGVPPALLRDAQGIAVIPGMIKASFVIGGRYGRGVLLTRGPDGAWGRPEFISLTGGSVGWQLGVQSTDVVLVFKTKRGLDRMRRGKLTLGADIAVAAGPIGRQAEAGTDARLEAEIYSYSRSRGLFAGLSVEGAALLLEPAATAAYYRWEPSGWIDRRTNQLIPVTPPSVKVQAKLAQLTAGPAPAFVVPTAPPAAPPQLGPPPPVTVPEP